MSASTRQTPKRKPATGHRPPVTGALAPSPQPLAPSTSIPTEITARMMPVAGIVPGARNARTDFNPERMAELEDSVREKGIIEPLIVRASAPDAFSAEPGTLDGKSGYFLVDWRIAQAHGVGFSDGRKFEQHQVEAAHAELIARFGDLYEVGNGVAALRMAFFKTEAEAQAAKPAWEIVAGERRFRAALTVGLLEVPAVIRTLTDAEAYDLSLIENLQRQDLGSMEEARGFRTAVDTLGYTAEELAAKIGKSKTYVYAMLKLFRLPSAASAALEGGQIEKSVAELIARMPNEKLRERFAAEVLKGYDTYEQGPAGYAKVNLPLSLRAVRELQRSSYMVELKNAAFAREDPQLVLEAGPCSACPKMTGNNREEFPDSRGDVCTDPVCFKSKTAASEKAVAEKGRELGLTMLKNRSLFSSHDNQMYSDEYLELDRQLPAQVLMKNGDGDTKEQAKLIKKRSLGQLLDLSSGGVGAGGKPATSGVADTPTGSIEVERFGVIDRKGRLRKLVKRDAAATVLKSKHKITLRAPSAPSRYDPRKEAAEREKRDAERKVKNAAIAAALKAVSDRKLKFSLELLELVIAELLGGPHDSAVKVTGCKTAEDFLRAGVNDLVSTGLRHWAEGWGAVARMEKVLRLAKVDLPGLLASARKAAEPKTSNAKTPGGKAAKKHDGVKGRRGDRAKKTTKKAVKK